ncbi:hypothetical protein J2847_002949 [Azospirillum agricola]|uniref:hypothetical protein n=1 Tax=Azospirillum agricola TaxID=1720247 RepID=UPI001AEAA95A|nr:hypothetical protein [Azospirillum agricola]MBP2229650.1 hypothetical protein [Azospirillum agricola]
MAEWDRALTGTIAWIECAAQRAGYLRATERLAQPLARIPDGHLAVGALDGVAVVVPAPATVANGNAAVSPDVAPTAACGASAGAW